MQMKSELFVSNINLASFSTYDIGGDARWLAAPKTAEEVLTALEQASASGLLPFLFGMGSNLLFPDQPSKEMLFISLREQVDFHIKGERLYVSAGTPMSLLALLGLHAGIPDFEFTFLLPGTLGGGIYMNAKYFDRQICDVLDTVYYIDLTAIGRGIQAIAGQDCEFAYKKSIFQRHPWVIVGADLMTSRPAAPATIAACRKQLAAPSLSISSLADFSAYFIRQFAQKPNPSAAASAALKGIIADRTGKHHFSFPSCGSVFKNNYAIGKPIGKLVESLGLKGTERGKAIISPTHGNVIQNRGGAKAQDVLDLIKLAQEEIYKHYDFVPEPEVVIV